jgi:hypothetical protein
MVLRPRRLAGLFAVTDFKVSAVDVELGAGYGFTRGSDRSSCSR